MCGNDESGLIVISTLYGHLATKLFNKYHADLKVWIDWLFPSYFLSDLVVSGIFTGLKLAGLQLVFPGRISCETKGIMVACLLITNML